MGVESQPHQVSWRDPAGFVVDIDGRILRAVAPAKADQARALLRAPWMSRLIADGSMPETTEVIAPPSLGEGRDRWFWLEHKRLGFPCYPHEITALQLYDAAVLTLQIALAAARDGWVLKDASAWNVLFSEGRPVFVDFLSFEPRETSDAWIAYGQFVRHFLLPLMLFRRLGMTPTEIFLVHRDGITPERAFELLPRLGLLSATGLELVVLPKMLSGAGGRLIESQTKKKSTKVIPSVGGDLLQSTLRRLLRMLTKLRPDNANSKSVWRDYEEERSHYGDRDIAAKTGFVRNGLEESTTVLDLGCNAGEFSLLAADAGKIVVAADADHPALSRLYDRVRGRNTRISPLLLSIGRPTPAIGWQNKEVASLLDRAAGHFDCVLMLGLIHHLLVGERMSLAMLADLLTLLNPKSMILEWIDPSDRKFKQLAGLNSQLYQRLSAADFEACLCNKFRLSAKLPLPCGTRVMYLWHR